MVSNTQESNFQGIFAKTPLFRRLSIKPSIYELAMQYAACEGFPNKVEMLETLKNRISGPIFKSRLAFGCARKRPSVWLVVATYWLMMEK